MYKAARRARNFGTWLKTFPIIWPVSKSSMGGRIFFYFFCVVRRFFFWISNRVLCWQEELRTEIVFINTMLIVNFTMYYVDKEHRAWARTQIVYTSTIYRDISWIFFLTCTVHAPRPCSSTIIISIVIFVLNKKLSWTAVWCCDDRTWPRTQTMHQHQHQHRAFTYSRIDLFMNVPCVMLAGRPRRNNSAAG